LAIKQNGVSGREGKTSKKVLKQFSTENRVKTDSRTYGGGSHAVSMKKKDQVSRKGVGAT